MDAVQNLLVLYIVLLVFNVVLTGALWARQRTVLHRDLFHVWAACTVSFMGQGALQHGAFQITVGFGFTFLATLALSNLLMRLGGGVFAWRPYVAGMSFAVALSALFAAGDHDFVWVALPVAVAVAAPLLVTTVGRIRAEWSGLPISGRALMISCLAFVAHNLDFPFLRDKEELAPLGFTVAVLIVFGLSITSNALVLERVAEDRARIAELNRIRSQFFANISHELRTPLTLIVGPVESMLEAGVEESMREPLGAVRRSAQRLLRMIDDLLDLSMLESGDLRLNVSSVHLGQLVRRVVEMAGPAAESKHLMLELEVCGLDDPVGGDPHRLEIIVTNLVGNALKYTPAGGRVTVRVESGPTGASVRVTDDGPGIPPNSVESIFERFVQIDGSATRKVGGVGIGLAFARELAELHGGTLTVESSLGEGSTFELALRAGVDHLDDAAVERRRVQSEEPLGRRVVDFSAAAAMFDVPNAPVREAPLEESSEPIRLERGRHARVLIAEDEPELRSYIVGILEGAYEVVSVADGERALAYLEEHRVDLVLTDVMMPGLSGVELCRAIKGDLSLGAPPVIMLTALTGTAAALEGYGAGADDFVSKPFHPHVLQARIHAQLKVRALSLQLADQARLVSAGSLAAGVAHEVRNPLNAIVNAARVLEGGGSPKVTNERLLEVIIDGVERIDQVVSTLDGHVRPADGEGDSLCQVVEGLESTLRLLGHRMGGIEVHRAFGTGGEVLAPARAFNQGLVNLVDNAILSGARELWVEVEECDGFVEVIVADDGPGVPPDAVERIFDPFFTTRGEGEGTGLGLYLSRKLARECGGELRYEERPGGGARFVLRLPRRGA